MDNAVGVRTKKSPSMDPTAFYTDEEYLLNCKKFREDLQPVYDHLKAGGVVVFPMEPLGSGLAQLEDKAPESYAYLQNMLESSFFPFMTDLRR